MERWFDTAAVLLFASATAIVALHSRGWFANEEHDAAGTVIEEPYVARVSAALPALERHVANGSMRQRGLECDETAALAEVTQLEAAVGPGDDPTISMPLARGIAALRECLACTPEAHACGVAAREFVAVENRLGLPRGPHGI